MSTEKINHAARIKLLREKLGNLSQAEMAKQIGLPKHKIADIEFGKVKISVEIAELLEEKFNVNFRWALTGEGEILSMREEEIGGMNVAVRYGAGTMRRTERESNPGSAKLTDDDVAFLGRLIDLVYSILTLGGQQQLGDSRQLILIVSMFCKLFFHLPDRVELLERFRDMSIEKFRDFLHLHKEIAE